MPRRADRAAHITIVALISLMTLIVILVGSIELARISALSGAQISERAPLIWSARSGLRWTIARIKSERERSIGEIKDSIDQTRLQIGQSAYGFEIHAEIDHDIPDRLWISSIGYRSAQTPTDASARLAVRRALDLASLTADDGEKEEPSLDLIELLEADRSKDSISVTILDGTWGSKLEFGRAGEPIAANDSDRSKVLYGLDDNQPFSRKIYWENGGLVIQSNVAAPIFAFGASGDEAAESIRLMIEEDALGIELDSEGYQNYLIKTRFKIQPRGGALFDFDRLYALYGSTLGFGVYFRAGRARARIDEGTGGAVKGLLWLYDPSAARETQTDRDAFWPCENYFARYASANGGAELNDEFGMIHFAGAHGLDQIDSGLEAGAYDELTQLARSTARYDARLSARFCPENFIEPRELANGDQTSGGGWEWDNNDWFGEWRTLYLIVHRNGARFYLDVEAPDRAKRKKPQRALARFELKTQGAIDAMRHGGVGIIVWRGAIARIGSFRVYPYREAADSIESDLDLIERIR